MIKHPPASGLKEKVLAVSSAIILVFISLAFWPAHTDAAESELVRLNMKSYGNHSATYDARILEIKPQFVIDNPPHGLYGEMYGYNDPTLLQNVAGYQSAGIKVIGYITCGYEGAGGADGYAPYWYSLDMQKKLITNMATLDKVDGVFIDECSDYPNTASKAYLKELTNLAHSYGMITWGNTGVDQFDEWFFTEGGFDYMQSSENWRGQSLSPVQQKWGSRIGVTGFNSSYTVDDAVRLTLDAWNKGLGFCYINTVEYVSIAPWFEEYAGILRANDGTVSPASDSEPEPEVVPEPEPAPAPEPEPVPVSDPAPATEPEPEPSASIESGNTTGIVSSEPRPTRYSDDYYRFYLQVTSTSVDGISVGSQILCRASITDFPNLLTVGTILTGDLESSFWRTWILEKADDPPSDSASTDTSDSTAVSGNTTATVASTPSPSGAYNEYNLFVEVINTIVTGISAGEQIWCAATTTDFPDLLTIGTVITGNLDYSLGWWVFSEAD